MKIKIFPLNDLSPNWAMASLVNVVISPLMKDAKMWRIRRKVSRSHTQKITIREFVNLAQIGGLSVHLEKDCVYYSLDSPRTLIECIKNSQ